VNSDSSVYLEEQRSDTFGGDIQSIALIGPDEDRRRAVASALAGCKSGEVREFFTYPASLEDLPKLVEQHFDVIAIDLDSNPEYALDLVEGICASGLSTVMVYSDKTDSEMLVRCMRAGAREYLTLPFAHDTMDEALARASARRPATRFVAPKKAGGRLLVFLGAKGGDGVTTLACNFAVAVAQESSQSTLLIDLDLPLGDAALNLGVSAEYSAINALQNASRLDSSFLSKLLVKHSSGVSVLAAPGKFPQFPATDEAIDRLIAVARQDFENVIIDMGSRLDLMGTSLFKDGSTVYLVIQAGIAGLRNSNRLISQYFATEVPKLEIVLNRFQSRSLGVAEDQITKALTRPAQWKIPNDYAAVRRMQHTAIPLALEDSPISRLIRQMARSACGLPATPEKGSGFSLKKISRSISAKISTSEEAISFMQPVIVPEQEIAGALAGAAQPEAALNSGNAADSASANGANDSQTQPKLKPVTPEDGANSEESAPAAEIAASPQNEPETRTYKGATYVRGDDGQWHLQKSQSAEEAPETPVIAWSTPAAIAYGVPLNGAQLNAMASTPGRFVYSPAKGELLPAGEHSLSVVFTPADTAGFTEAQATVQIAVAQATPKLTWQAPAPISCNTPLSAAQLNATASVPGEFAYTPAAGEVLPAGEHTLKLVFTPDDYENYTEAETAVQIAVSRVVPVILWPAPVPIAYGTALSTTQLNAATSAPGRFVYKPAAGEVLHAGVQPLQANFIPADEAGYESAQAVVALTVTQATPIITWPTPAAIYDGTALSAAELSASALVPGSFVYEPAVGEVLAAGTHTLTVTFTPTDSEDYTVVQAVALLTVTEKPVEAVETVWPVAPPTQIVEGAAFSPAPIHIPEPIPLELPLEKVEAVPVETFEAAPFEIEQPVAPVSGASKKASSKAAHKAAAKEKAKARKGHGKAHTKAPVEFEEEAPETAETQPVESQVKALVRAMAPKSPINVGSGLDLMGSAVFEDGTTIYLVMQPGSAGLSNANRLVSQFFSAGGPKPDFVINRFEPRAAGVPEGETSTALTRSATVPISRLAAQMAQPVAEQPPAPEKKGFSLKGFSRSIWTKFSMPEKPTGLGLTDDRAQSTVAQPERAAVWPIDSAPASASYGAPRMPITPAAPVSAYTEPETRIYKGATYLRGADGQWHLKTAVPVEAKGPAVWAMPAPAAQASGGFELKPTQAKPDATAPGAARKPAAKKKPANKKPVAKKSSAKAPAKGKAKAAQKKLGAKGSGKHPAKSAQKPTIKAASKYSVKHTQKPVVKVSAKHPVKTAAKPLAKAAGKHPVKTDAKTAAKAAAKLPVKVGQKPPQKAAKKVLPKAKPQKSLPARKKPAVAARPKVAKAVKPAQPLLPEVQEPVSETVAVPTVAEVVVVQTAPEAEK